MKDHENQQTDGIASYRVILVWLVVALLVAAGLAYLLIRPFALRVRLRDKLEQSLTIHGYGIARDVVSRAGCMEPPQLTRARSINMIGMPSKTG